jgi:hypothetical protein
MYPAIGRYLITKPAGGLFIFSYVPWLLTIHNVYDKQNGASRLV